MGRKQSPILNQNKLKLGIFSANCSGGMSVSKVPERWVNSWENNIRLAKLADDAGIEFLLPIARWIEYGGETDFHGSVLETLIWATGLLAHTKADKHFRYSSHGIYSSHGCRQATGNCRSVG